jgi:hypothetical protein
MSGRRAPADRDQQHLGLDRLAALDGRAHAVVGVLDLLERLADLEVDLPLTEVALELLRDLLVLGGDQAGQRLQDGHLGAERLPDAGELDADHAAAQHDRRRRHPVEPQRVLAGDDPLAVDLEAGQRARVGAAGQNHVAAGVAPTGHLDRVLADQLALAGHHGDVLVVREQAGETLVQAGDDTVLVRVHPRHVDADQLGLDAELLALPGLLGDLGRVQQRLGRDAAAVQARAAQLGLVDQRYGEVELGSAQGGRVAAAAGAEDDDVEGFAVRLAHVDSSGHIRRRVGHTKETVTVCPRHLVTYRSHRCSQVPTGVPRRRTLAGIERKELAVAWFRRRTAPQRVAGRPVDRADLEYLAEFVRTRRGVEAFIEPRTTVTETTVLLVAHDGEWTRRRIESPEMARRWAHGLSVPIYDVRLLGYPQRMRDYNARQKRQG